MALWWRLPEHLTLPNLKSLFSWQPVLLTNTVLLELLQLKPITTACLKRLCHHRPLHYTTCGQATSFTSSTCTDHCPVHALWENDTPLLSCLPGANKRNTIPWEMSGHLLQIVIDLLTTFRYIPWLLKVKILKTKVKAVAIWILTNISTV